jgi:hypothetical protein
MVGSFDPGGNSDNASDMIYSGNVNHRHECAMEAYAAYVEGKAAREINLRELLRG